MIETYETIDDQQFSEEDVAALRALDDDFTDFENEDTNGQNPKLDDILARPQGCPEYHIHPAASAWPRLENAEFDLLVKDIEENGLLQPIVVDRDNRIVDGRNRYWACQTLGIAPAYQVIDDSVDPWDYAVSANLKRRQLQPGQIAGIAANYYRDNDCSYSRKDGIRALAKRFGISATAIKEVLPAEAKLPGITDAVIAGDISPREANEVAKDDELREEVKTGQATVKEAKTRVRAKRKSAKKTKTVTEFQGQARVRPEGQADEVKPTADMTSAELDDELGKILGWDTADTAEVKTEPDYTNPATEDDEAIYAVTSVDLPANIADDTVAVAASDDTVADDYISTVLRELGDGLPDDMRSILERVYNAGYTAGREVKPVADEPAVANIAEVKPTLWQPETYDTEIDPGQIAALLTSVV